MDEILTHTLRIACILRESREAIQWRRAWNIMSEDFVDMSSLLDASDNDIPVAAQIRAVRISEKAQSRPIVFPLLVFKSTLIKSLDQLQSGMHNYPKEWGAFELLRNCLRSIALIIEFLRSIAPGYPFEDLIYSTPNTHWRELSSENELPWGLGEQLMKAKSTDARFIGLNRFVPTVADIIVKEMNYLSSAIMQSQEWKNIKTSHETIMSHPNLAMELVKAKELFEKEVRKIHRPNYPNQRWIDDVENLATQIYAKKGPRIGKYIDAFQKYQHLIERIYWVLSQGVFYSNISSISSQHPDQLQQISLSEEQVSLLTAISITKAQTLDVGQLIHISLPETNHLVDGIYQVEHVHLRFDIISGARNFFRARRLWQCQIDEIVTATNEFKNGMIIESEHTKGEDDYKFVIGSSNDEVILEAGYPITEFAIHKTMHLL